jgi:chromatin remodeling complex protein RSC6
MDLRVIAVCSNKSSNPIMPRQSKTSQSQTTGRRVARRKARTTQAAETKPVATNEPVTSETTPTNEVISRSTRAKVDIADVIETFYSEVSSLREQFSELRSRFNDLRTSFTEYNSNLTAFDKLATRTVKALQKGRRRRTTNGDYTPSGFNKPSPISSELAAFLNKPADFQMSRTDVTRALSAYIKEHNLQNPENRKFIIPDAPLASLLHINRDDTLSYFNLQKHLKHLFVSGEQTQQQSA